LPDLIPSEMDNGTSKSNCNSSTGKNLPLKSKRNLQHAFDVEAYDSQSRKASVDNTKKQCIEELSCQILKAPKLEK